MPANLLRIPASSTGCKLTCFCASQVSRHMQPCMAKVRVAFLTSTAPSHREATRVRRSPCLKPGFCKVCAVTGCWTASGSPKASGFDRSCIPASAICFHPRGMLIGVVAGCTHPYMPELLLTVAVSKGPINGKVAGMALPIATLPLLENRYLRVHRDSRERKEGKHYEVCNPCLKTFRVSLPSTFPQTGTADFSVIGSIELYCQVFSEIG